MNLRFLMPFVLYPGNNLMSDKINDDYLIHLSLEYHDIIVVRAFFSSKVGGRKGCNPGLMLIFLGNSTGYCVVLPHVKTLSNVSYVFCVLVVVNDYLTTWILQHVCVEECYILGADARVDLNESPVHFVNKVQRNLFAL